MLDELLTTVAHGPWALPILAALVIGDAFLVVVPGEIAVTAFGALAATTGSPPLLAVILVAGLAAFTGDACLYMIGRGVGLTRWRWMRGPRATHGLEVARHRLQRHAASVVFTSRFVPFARLAVALTAGATRVSAARYLCVAGLAAFAWATYQAVVGAVVAMLVPGGPVAAVVVSVVVALLIGLGVDRALNRPSKRRPDTDSRP